MIYCFLLYNSAMKNPYQNRSPFRRFENCWAIIQAKVGPTSPPTTGLSAIPPVNKSMSSTVLKNECRQNICLMLPSLCPHQ